MHYNVMFCSGCDIYADGTLFNPKLGIARPINNLLFGNVAKNPNNLCEHDNNK